MESALKLALLESALLAQEKYVGIVGVGIAGILSSSQFLLLPQLPQKVEFTSKVVKVDSKIIVSLHEI
jgi:hypothetical protein